MVGCGYELLQKSSEGSGGDRSGGEKRWGEEDEGQRKQWEFFLIF